MIDNRPRGIPSSAKKHMNKAFEEIEQYAVNYTDTEHLIAQLLIRMGDWFEDIDPYYDEWFAHANQESLQMMFNAMQRCNRDNFSSRAKSHASVD